MFRKSHLSLAVSAAVGLSAMGAAPMAIAQEELGLEEVFVTGSRIKRADLKGASPVVAVTTEDIKMEGDFTVADALRSSTLNSFGSFSERSGSAAQSQAEVNLRGAGSSRTLVLLNGRRFPGSPTLGGASANLNAIPMAAVERIEILTDGASSTYGSDALAGVVNVILKEDFEGLTVSFGAGHRDQDEGLTSREFSIVGGASNDRGNITFSYDHQMREGISDGARDYTKAKMTDFNGDGIIQAYRETDGWSIYGATVASPDSSEMQASPLCDNLVSAYGEDTFRKVAADKDWSPGSTYCMYAYANVSYNTASIDRNTVYVNTKYDINDSIEWFGSAMFVQNSSFGRYAPPAAPWRNMAADNPHNPYGEETTGYFRWVDIGTRDGNVDDYNQDYVFGFRGDLDWNNGNWEVYYHKNIADNKSIGEYYLSYAGLAYNIANGIDLGSPEGVANMKATTLQQASGVFDQFFAGFGFDMFELPGGVVGHYVGAEYFEQSYKDIYDAQSEANRIGGSAGNSAQGTRDVTAFFYEAVLPVVDSVEVNLAVRYDDYSDFGDNVSPKVSVRWQTLDDLVLRASYTEAFRAPALDEMHAATSFSAEEAIDYAQGATETKQYDTYYKANANLGAETSEYLNLGAIWDINAEMSITLDYFKLKIDEVIQTKTVQSLLDDEARGLISALPPGTDTSNQTFYLIRASSGTLLEAGTGYFNGIGFEIEGVDLGFSGMWETNGGTISLTSNNSFVLGYDEERGGQIVDTAGWSGQPDFRSVLTLGWSLGNHSASWSSTYIDSTTENEKLVDGVWKTSGKLDSWLVHNMTYTYDTQDYGRVTFTVNNVADEDPVLTSKGKWDDADLYNNYGRDYRVTYTIDF